MIQWLRRKLIKWLKIPVKIEMVEALPRKVEALGYDDWARISRLFVDNPGLYALWANEREGKIQELENVVFSEDKDRRRIELIAEIRVIGRFMKYNELALPEMNRILMEMNKEQE